MNTKPRHNGTILNNESGFGMIELLVVIVIIWVMSAIAMQSMNVTLGNARKVKTEREMEMLTHAIAGNPSLTSNGLRSDFGYIGDIGAFPPDLQSLLSNQGGYPTWNGPYIPSSFISDTTGFKKDEWGQPYAYSGGVLLASSGGGNAISMRIADASSDYLLNQLNGTITDAEGTLPGSIFADSIKIVATVPNGTGSIITKTYQPDMNGAFTLDSMPVGHHSVDLIYEPTNDTLHRYVTIVPRNKSQKHYRFADPIFGAPPTGGPSGGLELVAGSETIVSSGGLCDRIIFEIQNTSTTDIDVTSIILTYSSTTYYRSLKIKSIITFNSQNPRNGSDDPVTFSTETIAAGSTETIEVSGFCDNQNGNCSSQTNMSGTTITVTFSEGSSFDITFGVCP